SFLMNAKDAIRGVYGFADMVLNRYLADLSDADLLVRPVPGQHHIAYQLGHLIGAERNFVESIKPGLSPALPGGFGEAHGRDEASVSSDDPKPFSPKETYLNLYKAQRQATPSLLDSLSEADLDAPSPERFRQFLPTVGAVMTLVGTHVLM